MCVNFLHERRDLQFNIDSELQIFEKHFHGRFYLTVRVFARNLLRKEVAEKINLMIDLGMRTQAFVSNKPKHYILDHGDFTIRYNLSYEK